VVIPTVSHAIVTALLLGLISLSGGCASTNWTVVSPIIEHVSATGARIAFTSPEVANHKPEICMGVSYVAEALEDWDDPNATFEQLRQLTLEALDKLPLTPNIQPVVVVVVDGVMTSTVGYFNTFYSGLIEKDEARAVLAIARAVSRGLNSACGESGLSAAPSLHEESFLFPVGSDPERNFHGLENSGH